MPTLVEADAFYRDQRKLSGRALTTAAAIWGDRAPADFDGWFDSHVEELVALTTQTQTRVAERSIDYVGKALAEQRTPISPDVDVNPAQLIGVAGDGRPLDTLMRGAVITAKSAIANAPRIGDAVPRGAIRNAWAESGKAAMIVRMQTAIADTSRVATGLGTISRPDVGYTRMLVGSSCSRCAVLAGRSYRSASPFLRHPGCDCRHVPGRVRHLAMHTVDVASYFEKLPVEEQDRRFTKAGAQAIRDGADPNQVINARRGAGLDYASGRITSEERAAIRALRTKTGARRMSVLPVTTEGTTRRGIAYTAMRTADGPTPPQRLMPEAIYQAATDREDTLRLLKMFGYVL